jgi:hypothetical protein
VLPPFGKLYFEVSFTAASHARPDASKARDPFIHNSWLSQHHSIITEVVTIATSCRPDFAGPAG